MRSNRLFICISFTLILMLGSPANAEHRVLLQGNNKLAIVGTDGEIEWEMKWGGIHDLHVLENGHIMLQRNMREVVEIDPENKEVVWSYDSSKENGNEGKKIEVHAFQPLANGNIMIAESGPGRIIEINRDGEIQKEFALKIDNPHPHTDTRLVRKLDNGHYLACHERDGAVREYDEDGKVVWEYEIPMFGKAAQGGHGLGAFGNKCFGALRLENGNTLIATGNGHSVIEVTPEKKIVWQIHQNDLPGIQLAWVTTLEVLPNGNYMIGNCHAGPNNPLLIEVEPKTRKVVWQLDKYDVFGNSVPNSVVLDSVDEKRADAEPKTLSMGDPAPELAIHQWIKGDEVTSFEDGKVYVVEFWATWCGPCLAGMPHISELQREYGDRVHFVGVTDEDQDTISRFLKKEAKGGKTWDDVIMYTLAVDERQTTTKNYMFAAKRNGIPCAFIVGKDQHIEWIGHPMAIDDTLAAVVADEWDREAEAEKYEKAQAAKRQRDQAMVELDKAFRSENWDAALAVVAGLQETGVNQLQAMMLKAQILQKAGRREELQTLRSDLVEESWKDEDALNEIAWGIAISAGEKSDEELELALRAIERANELTEAQSGSVLDTLARVQYEMGNLDAAIDIQKKAAELEPIQQIKAALAHYEAEKAKQVAEQE